MKKNTLKSVVSALAVSAVALSASAMTVFAGAAGGQKYDLGDLDLSKATVKPTLTLSSEKLDYDAAKGATVTITLTVGGADKKYAATGLHVNYDSRLKLVPNEDDELATKGPAGSGLGAEIQPDGTHGIFMATDASGDKGKNGVLWSFDFQLPTEIDINGDKFPIEIVYQTKPSAEDLFTNVAKDEVGELMQAYVFTQGVTQGVIEVAPSPTTTPTTTRTTTTTVKSTTSTTTSKTTSSTSSTSKTTSSTTTTKVTSSTSSTSTVSTSSTSAKASGSAKTTKPATTTKKAATTGKASNASKTGVAGAGVAVAGLAIAVGTAFAFRKKED